MIALRRRRRRRGRARSPTRPGSPSPTTTRPARSCSPATATRFDRGRGARRRARQARAIRLPVAGAFHSPSMAPAVAPFRAALDEVELGEPRFTVFSCATAEPFADVRDELARRADPARPLAGDVHRPARRPAPTRFVEVGPGKVLARLAKRIVAGTKVETPAEGAAAMPDDRRPSTPAPRHTAAARPARTARRRRPRPQAARPRRPERPDRRAHRRRRRVDRPPHRHPRAPLRRATTSAPPTSPPPPPGARSTDAGLHAVRRRPRPRRHDDARRADAERRRPLVANALGHRASARIDIGAACTGFLVGARPAGAAQIETGRADARARDRRGDALAHHRPGRQAHRRAVRRRRRRGRARRRRATARSAPILLGTDGAHGATRSYADARRALHPHGRPHDVQQGRQGRSTESTRTACRARRPDARRHRPLRLPPGQRPDPRGRRRASSSSPPERVADYVGETGNTSAASIPLALSLLREDGRLRPGQRLAARRRRRRLHLGRGRRRVGGALAACPAPREPSRSSPARPRASAPRSRARSPPTAGTSRSTTAPTRTAPRRPWPRSRRPAARPPRSPGDVANGAPGDALQRRRGGARRPGARARQQRRRARRQPRDPDRGRGLGHRARHEPVRGLPPDASSALAADAQGALRPDRQRRLRRRPARQRRPGELRRREGRPDRLDQDRRRTRSRAAASRSTPWPPASSRPT